MHHMLLCCLLLITSLAGAETWPKLPEAAPGAAPGLKPPAPDDGRPVLTQRVRQLRSARAKEPLVTELKDGDLIFLLNGKPVTESAEYYRWGFGHPRHVDVWRPDGRGGGTTLATDLAELVEFSRSYAFRPDLAYRRAQTTADPRLVQALELAQDEPRQALAALAMVASTPKSRPWAFLALALVADVRRDFDKALPAYAAVGTLSPEIDAWVADRVRALGFFAGQTQNLKTGLEFLSPQMQLVMEKMVPRSIPIVADRPRPSSLPATLDDITNTLVITHADMWPRPIKERTCTVTNPREGHITLAAAALHAGLVPGSGWHGRFEFRMSSTWPEFGGNPSCLRILFGTGDRIIANIMFNQQLNRDPQPVYFTRLQYGDPDNMDILSTLRDPEATPDGWHSLDFWFQETLCEIQLDGKPALIRDINIPLEDAKITMEFQSTKTDIRDFGWYTWKPLLPVAPAKPKAGK